MIHRIVCRDMTHDQIVSIESALDLELAENYKESLHLVDNQYGNAPFPFRFPHNRHFVTGPEELIELNKLLWSSPEGCWSDVAEPIDYFFIGKDGCGNYYCIDPDDDDSPVFFLCHDPLEFYESAPSLMEFIGQLSNPPREEAT